MLHRIESYIELVHEDKLVRWATIVGVALLWLAIAWLNPGPLVLLAALAAGTVWVRKHRGPYEPDPTDELF